jgi:hypothetical protein
VTDVPTSGNSPHHLGPSKDGKTLIGGGLLSLLKTQDTAFYWDVSNPYRPVFKKSNRALLASITDEIRAKPEGWVTTLKKNKYQANSRTKWFLHHLYG